MYDVQLQITSTGRLAWSQTFTDAEQAAAYEQTLDADLDDLDEQAFAKKYGVPCPD